MTFLLKTIGWVVVVAGTAAILYVTVLATLPPVIHP
jgi:hypothetical protein